MKKIFAIVFAFVFSSFAAAQTVAVNSAEAVLTNDLSKLIGKYTGTSMGANLNRPRGAVIDITKVKGTEIEGVLFIDRAARGLSCYGEALAMRGFITGMTIEANVDASTKFGCTPMKVVLTATPNFKGLEGTVVDGPGVGQTIQVSR